MTELTTMYWIAFGDVHESTDVLDSIPGLAGAEGVIITGDLTNVGTREVADRVLGRISAMNPRILAQPGNMDTEAVQSYLKERDIDIHLRVREIAPDLGLMGVGLSSPTPFGTPGEVEESVLGKWLEETYLQAKTFKQLIVAIHEPPYGTRLDMLGNGQHVGSRLVRDFIERVQPAAVITGHIHESVGCDHIGRTPVFNPGMLAGGRYVRLEYRECLLTATLMSV